MVKSADPEVSNKFSHSDHLIFVCVLHTPGFHSHLNLGAFIWSGMINSPVLQC